MNFRSIHTKPGIIYVILFVILFALNANGQTAMLSSERYPELRYNNLLGSVVYNDYIQIKGSAFLTEDWMVGDIILKDGKEINNIKFKLDAYAQRILVFQEIHNRVVLVDKSLIKEFYIYTGPIDRRFILEEESRTKAKSSDGSFLEVLGEGTVSLYRLYYRDVLPLGANEGLFLEEFTVEDVYYVKINGKYSTLRLSRGFFLHQYSQYKSELKQYFRHEKLQPKKEADFIMALNYLNSLLAAKDGD